MSFLIFIILVLFCFTLPGVFLIKTTKINLNIIEKIILGSVNGFVLFTFVSYILLVLKIPFLIFFIVAILDILFLKRVYALKKIDFKINFFSKFQLIILCLTFFLGILGQLAIISPSGIKLNNDLVFFSSNGHDGPWHIALMQEIKKGYPLQNPSFAQEKLVNYHFFSDVAPAIFSQFFYLSDISLYFRFFPLLYSILIGSVAFLLGRKITNSFNGGIWSSFFIYFSGSFGYVATWIQNHSIGGESLFWATQIQSSIGNPPQIISDILVLTFIYFFILYIQQKNKILFFLQILILSSLAEFKIYASIVLLISLFIVGFWDLIKYKRLELFSIAIFSSLISAILYLPNSSNSTGFLIFEPWWYIRTMTVARLNWVDLELKRQTYIHDHNYKRVFQIEATGFFIFFFGNLGTKSLGLIYLFKSFKKYLHDQSLLLMLLISLVGFILPLLFLQKGVASNTIQFMQYFILMFGIFSTVAITKIQSRIVNNIFKLVFILLIIIFSVPTQLGLLYDFYHKPPISKISSSELEALNFLEDHTDKNSIIISAPFNKDLNLHQPTPPIWAWFDTSYISAFSGRRNYLADLEQVDIMGYDYHQRLASQKLIFQNSNSDIVATELKKDKINYLYFPKLLRPTANLTKYLNKIFDNGEIEIWQVD